MIRIATIAALSTLLLALPAQAETRAFDLPAFSSATFQDALDVRIDVGPVQSISVEARSGAEIDDLRFDVTDGKLNVWRQRDIFDVLSFRDSYVLVTITVPALDGVAAYSSTKVEVDGVTSDALRIEVASAGNIIASNVTAKAVSIDAASGSSATLSGTCETVELASASGANVNAGDLKCVDADITSASGSHAVLYTSGLVNAEVASGAQVELAGNPKHVDDEEDSGGNVRVIR